MILTEKSLYVYSQDDNRALSKTGTAEAESDYKKSINSLLEITEAHSSVTQQ